MALPATGPISMAQIAAEFGGAAPHALSEYYGVVAGIPASGQISMSQFYGKSAPPGQVVITTQGTSIWTVSPGVQSICMVAVQPGGDASGIGATVTVNGTVVCRALNGSRIGDGGGDGGLGGAGYATFPLLSGGGGGGAGGYNGNGGNGQGMAVAVGATGGLGGGGGGARAGYINQNNPPGMGNGGGGGGGVDLKGQGANGNQGVNYGGGGGGGSNGAKGADGFPGTGPGGAGGNYGGGGGGTSAWSQDGHRGGALAWKNSVSVTPGQVITFYIPAPGSNGTHLGGIGAVRILWGDGRSYPNNAGDM